MKFKKALSVITNFKELIGLLSFYLALVANPLAPDLDVNYDISDYFAQNNTEISKKNESSKVSIFNLKLTNKSNSPITDMEIEIRGIEKVISIGGRSSSFRINNVVQNNIEYEARGNNSIFLKNVTNLPPGHNVQIQIIGQYFLFLLEDRVHIASSAKSQSIAETTKISGFLWGFIYDQSPIIFSVLAAVLIFLGLKRLYQEGGVT